MLFCSFTEKYDMITVVCPDNILVAAGGCSHISCIPAQTHSIPLLNNRLCKTRHRFLPPPRLCIAGLCPGPVWRNIFTTNNSFVFNRYVFTLKHYKAVFPLPCQGRQTCSWSSPSSPPSRPPAPPKLSRWSRARRSSWRGSWKDWTGGGARHCWRRS